MSVSYRRMQPKDVAKCVEHIAAHPVLGPRYGELIKDLPSAIRSTIGRDAATACLVEESAGSKKRFLGAGMAVFVSDDFLSEVKFTPNFWIGPELVKRLTRGRSPLLSDGEVRDANSTVGLNLVVWHASPHPQDFVRADVGTALIVAFEANYRGYRLREVIAQADCVENAWQMRNAGGFRFDRLTGRYASLPEVSAKGFTSTPLNVGMTRELALTRAASWVGSLFLYETPRFGFSRSEQRQLQAALTGGTDKELADALGYSVFTIKKTWRAIYDRVAAQMPELVPSYSEANDRTQRRGKQKKQRLLDYLRDHPEELRPVLRKLLERAAAPPKNLVTR